MEKVEFSKAVELIQFLAQEMDAVQDELAHLDSLTGDGDLGVTITLIFRAMKRTAPSLTEASGSEIFTALGEQVGEMAPSTFGTLVATMLKSIGSIIGTETAFDAPLFAKALSTAAAAVMERGKAKPGDKTLLDALCPAAEAAEAAGTTENDLMAAAKAAAVAAREGAEKTISMKAATGRAGYMGERTVGQKDPGAEAISKMLDAFCMYLSQGS